MSVEFTEENNNFNTFELNKDKGLTNWLVARGIVKTKKGAEGLLLLITIICVALTVILVTS
jgi:hypothetical protein